MAEATTVETSTEAALGDVLEVLVELMRTGTRPDVLEAQRVLLERLAHQGDVFPSRVPPPLNITEVGGYLNLLESFGQSSIRAGAVASALGVAGPPPQTASLVDAVPVGFVEIANDRPAGTAQASIPPLLTIRADFHGPLSTALASIHAAGCALPLRAKPPRLPATQPGATPVSLDIVAVLDALGRALTVFPGTVLVDPLTDSLAIARLETPAASPFQLVAAELDGGSLVPAASWVAKRASSSTAVDDPPASRRYLELAPILEAAGWRHPEPLALPASRSEPGTLARLVNVTGMVAGETTLGAELSLLYPPAAIARSALSNAVEWVWDGAAFAAP